MIITISVLLMPLRIRAFSLPVPPIGSPGGGVGTCDKCAVTMREVPENQCFTSVIAFASLPASLPAVVFVTLTDLNG
jgi:hypothetical protein